MFGLEKTLDKEELRKGFNRSNVYDTRKELGYQAQRSGVSFVTRRVAELGTQAIENSADVLGGLITNSVGSILEFAVGPEIARNLGLFAGAIGGSMAGIASMGVAGGISAGFSQMDYLHQKRNLRDLYREELAAKLNKSPSEVTVRDMEDMAKHNPVLDEELKRAKKQRNFSVPLAVVATLASFAVAVTLLPVIPGAGGLLLKAAVSMATYLAVKTPLQVIGNRMLGLKDETANDRIFEIKLAHERGVEITAEDIMPVMVKANPLLGETITKEFGARFDDLPPEKYALAAQKIKTLAPVEALAAAINNGTIETTELLFASIGDRSGVPPTMPDSAVIGAENPTPQVSLFQDKLSPAKRNSSVGFTERLTQASAEASATVGSTLA